MKKLNTGEEINQLPNGSVIILGIDRSDVNGAPLQRQSNGEWYGIGLPVPIDVIDGIVPESFPVGVVYEGKGDIRKPTATGTATADELARLVFGEGR